MRNRRESISKHHMVQLAEDAIYCTAVFTTWLLIAAFADVLLRVR